MSSWKLGKTCPKSLQVNKLGYMFWANDLTSEPQFLFWNISAVPDHYSGSFQLQNGSKILQLTVSHRLLGDKEPLLKSRNHLPRKVQPLGVKTEGNVVTQSFKIFICKAELSFVPHFATQEANENYQRLSGIEWASGNNRAHQTLLKTQAWREQGEGLVGISNGDGHWASGTFSQEDLQTGISQ